MYRLWYAGELGNTPHSWKTLDEFRRSGFTGLVGIRSLIRGGPCSYYNRPEDLPSLLEAWPCAYSLTEAMPDHRLMIQGEVMRGVGGIVLTYGTTANVKMRDAMKHPETATGVIAVALLRHYLWPTSFDEIASLHDQYPDAVIEFGAYDCAVGVLSRRNTVIWEVRGY
jgi:hypothetical protein